MSVESPEPPREEPPKGAVAAPEAPAAAPVAEDWATRYKYLLADFENYRRRSERERETITRQSRAGMLRELLPIVEAFRTARNALNHLPASDPVRRGLEILDREWMTFLKHEGVEPVATVGHPFRADEAEAVGDTSADEQHPDGTVAEIVQQGYRFFGGLLRPAKVVVARAPSPAASTRAAPAGEKTPEEP
jgi:molecular chaperone GrpE